MCGCGKTCLPHADARPQNDATRGEYRYPVPCYGCSESSNLGSRKHSRLPSVVSVSIPRPGPELPLTVHIECRNAATVLVPFSRMRHESDLKLLQALPIGFGNETVDKRSAKKADTTVEK